MPTDALGQLAQYGLLGIILALIIWAYSKKDDELKDSKKEFTDYLIAKGEKDGELKNQLLTFMQNLTNMISQNKHDNT